EAGEVAGIGEARGVLADSLSEDRVEVGADAVGATLLDRVARDALGENGFALRRISRGEQRAEIGSGVGRPCFLGAFDRISHLVRAVRLVGLEVEAAGDGQAEADDASEKGPAGDGIEAILHRRISARVRAKAGLRAALVSGAAGRKSDSHLSAARGPVTRQRPWTVFPPPPSRSSKR